MSDESARLAAREVIFKEGGESDGLYIVQSAWIHPSLSDYCRVTSDAAGEDLFGQRQAVLVGIELTVLTVIGLAVSIPYWHMLGILAP